MEFIGFSEETTKWFKSFFQIGISKFLLKILSQNLETSNAELLKDAF